MNIRNKLLVQFSVIVITLLLIFASSIYFFLSQYQKSEYSEKLEVIANTAAGILLNAEKTDENPILKFDQSPFEFSQESVYVFNQNNNLIACFPPAATHFTDTALVNQIRQNKTIQQNKNEKSLWGALYTTNKSDFIIIVAGVDKYGIQRMENLKTILIFGFMIGAIITLIVGMLFAKRAMLPILNIINQVKNITVSNLNQRVDEGNKKDEMAQLAITFNQMLQRIESAFILQRDFVSNAAHELRTPLTVLRAEVDYALMQQRDAEHYKKALFSFSEEIKKLSTLSNGLLELARISFDKATFNLKSIRVDELLVETCNTVLSQNSNYKIDIGFSALPENEDDLSISGNEQILNLAFKNLIDNACKFSDAKSVIIKLETNPENLTLKFSDQGIGIHPDDIEHIFQPFYRGKNTQSIAGHGIGLALTSKIIQLHRGTITAESELGKGSTFTVILPNRKYF